MCVCVCVCVCIFMHYCRFRLGWCDLGSGEGVGEGEGERGRYASGSEERKGVFTTPSYRADEQGLTQLADQQRVRQVELPLLIWKRKLLKTVLHVSREESAPFDFLPELIIIYLPVS